MSEVFDQSARPGPPGGDDAVQRLVKWLVGDRLSSVLLVGDTALAFRLSEQGHEVVVVGDDVRAVRDPQSFYVRAAGPRLPFRPDAFDAVVVPRLEPDQTLLAEYARVLRPGGVLSTSTRRHDETIPWVRRLREIVGRRAAPPPGAEDALAASGIFAEPEHLQSASWEELDLPGLLQYARESGRQPVDDASLARVRQLFTEATAHTGSLRLRHDTRSVRARVDKAAAPTPPPPPDPSLIDLR